jgi:hypothetical protein
LIPILIGFFFLLGGNNCHYCRNHTAVEGPSISIVNSIVTLVFWGGGEGRGEEGEGSWGRRRKGEEEWGGEHS